MEKRHKQSSSTTPLERNLLLVSWPEGRISWLTEELARLLGVTSGEAAGSQLEEVIKVAEIPTLRQLLYQPGGSVLYLPLSFNGEDEIFAVRIDRGAQFLLLEFTRMGPEARTESEASDDGRNPLVVHECFDETIQSLHHYKGSVYHDLMSPLNSIKGFVDLLAEDYGEQVGDYGRFALEIIRKSAVKLSDLITGLNRLSRLEQVVPNEQAVEIEPLIKQAWQSVLDKEKETAQGRQIELHIERPLASPRTDPKLLYTLLEIGLSNAVKFTRSQAQAQVWVSATERGAQWRCSIRDNGIGFDPGSCEKAFGLFTRLVSDDDYPGIGLGLTIAERIIDRLNGRIWLETVRHEGATLIWEIPQARG